MARPLLPRIAALLALVAGSALLGAAGAQDYVQVTDDGRIQPTSVYPGDTITFEPGELGSAIEDAWLGDAALPFEGQEISVVTLQSGNRGAISGGALNWAPAFSELTGATVNIVERPFNDLSSVIFTDLRTGTGAYDGFIPRSTSCSSRPATSTTPIRSARARTCRASCCPARSA